MVEQANNGLFPFTAISSRLCTYKYPVQANKSSKTANESSFPEHKKADFLPSSTAKQKELQISAY